ncbi:uncharacterized protein NEMAJ01_0707 [Nematocida major]|uniref:uncharacterized protein n=1 Tax=Nematocida major TaxID=1912982 RepID=UPI002008C413|nr:uncharacterized protein NEMAJ01_0707 [Nematocida major]KAH9385811.1 hypothetical protein NEMAJ01_0707 [Nematocida major]
MHSQNSPERLPYFSTKNEAKRFYCQPALSLFEHFLIFQEMPKERKDILQALDKYFNLEPNQHSRPDTVTPFKSVEISWEDSELPESRTFPLLNEHDLSHYDIWQHMFIDSLLCGQVEESSYMKVLRKATSPTLRDLYEGRESLPEALKVLKRHAFLSVRSTSHASARQDDFLFFRDYVRRVTSSVETQERVGLISPEIKRHVLSAQIESGLCICTKQWINLKSLQGMSWGKILEYIEGKESAISEFLIKEAQQNNQNQQNQQNNQQNQENNQNIQQNNPNQQNNQQNNQNNQNIQQNNQNNQNNQSISAQSGNTPRTGVYCTHHRISTHTNEECYALNSRNKKETPGNAVNARGSTFPGKLSHHNVNYALLLSGVSESVPSAEGLLNGVNANFILNAGLDVNLITTESQKMLGLFKIRGDSEIDFTSENFLNRPGKAEGGLSRVRSVSASVSVGERESVQRFILVPSNNVKLILGMPWIQDNYPTYILHLVPQNMQRQTVSELTSRVYPQNC